MLDWIFNYSEIFAFLAPFVTAFGAGWLLGKRPAPKEVIIVENPEGAESERNLDSLKKDLRKPESKDAADTNLQFLRDVRKSDDSPID